MKKIISILAITLTFVLNLSAQEYFYYSGGEKIPLTKVPGSEFAIYKIKKNNNNFALERISFNERMVGADSIGELIAQTECYVNADGLKLSPSGYFNIKLKQSDDYHILIKIAEENNLEIVKRYNYMPLWYVLRLKNKISESIIDLANRIYEMGLFASCYPAFSFNPEELSYDPQVNQQWGLFNDSIYEADINVSKAGSFATGRGIKIAFIDSGVDAQHKDLKDNILLSYDFHADTTLSEYYSNHGTFCAGIAVAKRNNGEHITGIAPDAKILAAGINTGGELATQEIADAITWACQEGADIISCSQVCDDTDALREAIDNAITYGRNGMGCVFVKSAGNDGYITFPGTYRDEIIVVGAIDCMGELYSGSGVGPNLFICAPGVNILSLSPNSQTLYGTGTSAACPHVSGVVALMLERNPNITINQIHEILAEAAVKVGNTSYNLEGEFGLRNNSFGYGLVNAYQAVINTPRN